MGLWGVRNAHEKFKLYFTFYPWGVRNAHEIFTTLDDVLQGHLFYNSLRPRALAATAGRHSTPSLAATPRVVPPPSSTLATY
jgi:hypothetical protein